MNAWVRVKGNLEYVKQLCANGFEAEEGGEEEEEKVRIKSR